MRNAMLKTASAAAGLMLMTSAFAAGPFGAFGGDWRGTGRVSDIHGHTEPLTCKSSNAPAPDGIAMSLSLVCASDSYKVDFHSDLYTDGHNLRGTWSETTRNASGEVQGTISPDLIRATTTAPGFSANIVIKVQSARKLDVSLNATGTSINHVEVMLKR